MLGQASDDNYFANLNCTKNVECVLYTSEMSINVVENGIRAKKMCSIYAEKVDFKDLIQLRLNEKCDPRRMYITTVDCASFQELKQDQALHVTFAGFIENLMRMLSDCQNGKLELNLIHKERTDQRSEVAVNVNYQLQFVEMRTFKNLVHLCLPCRAAPLNVVLFYVNNMLEEANKKAIYQEQISRQLRVELTEQQHHVEHLDEENSKLQKNLVENARSLNDRHSEQIQKMQQQLHELNEQRKQDGERSHKNLAGMQIQLGKVKQENKNLLVEKEQDLKRIETLNEELASTKSKVFMLKEQNEKLHADLTAMKNYERKQDLNMDDARKQVSELHDKLKVCSKENANLMAELEAERKILQTKRQALEMATEEISKANQIIFKQNQEINKHKKTIELRTEVALQQEKAIKEKELSLRLRDNEILHMRQTIESLHKEIPEQLESMRKFAHSLEIKYTKEIQSLKARLSSASGKENLVANGLQRSNIKRN